MFGRARRLRNLQLETARLRRENELMCVTLAWYADSDNWRRKSTNQPGEPLQWVKAPASFDRGARAKMALAIGPSEEDRSGVIERLLDQFIGNAAGEPEDGAAPSIVPPAIDPLSIRMES